MSAGTISACSSASPSRGSGGRGRIETSHQYCISDHGSQHMNPSIGGSRARFAVSRASALAVALCLCTGKTCAAQDAPPFYVDKTKLLVWRDAGKEHPIKSKEDWSKRREHILRNMQLVMGPLPDAK